MIGTFHWGASTSLIATICGRPTRVTFLFAAPKIKTSKWNLAPIRSSPKARATRARGQSVTEGATALAAAGAAQERESPARNLVLVGRAPLEEAATEFIVRAPADSTRAPPGRERETKEEGDY